MVNSMKKYLFPITFILVVGFVSAINFYGDLDMKGNAIKNVNASALPVSCTIANSWISQYSFSNSTCRTLNYTAVIGYTYPSLAGAGKALLCVDANGLIYRGNATGCP